MACPIDNHSSPHGHAIMNKCILTYFYKVCWALELDQILMFVDLVVEISYWLFINLFVRGHANNLLDNVLNFSKFNVFGQMALLTRDMMQMQPPGVPDNLRVFPQKLLTIQNNAGKYTKDWWNLPAISNKMSILRVINFSYIFQQFELLWLSKTISMFLMIFHNLIPCFKGEKERR